MAGQDRPELIPRDLFALDSDDSVTSDSSDEVSTDTNSFIIDDDFSNCSSTCAMTELPSIDDLLDANAIAMSVRGHPNPKKKQQTRNHESDLRPIAFIRFNTRVGKAKRVMVKALLNSGASASFITEKYTKKLKKRQAPQGWSTPGGELNTNKMVKSQFTMPELQDDKLIEWNMYATKDLGNYDMIIGRDILQFLGINIQFSTQEVVWDGYASMPFKDFDATALDSYHIEDPDGLLEDTDRLKKILDAKYVPADLEKLCQSQVQLQKAQQKKLLDLLQKHSALFDGTLCLWKDAEVSLDLKEDAKPYHARAYPVPQCHINTLRAEVERLCEIGVLKQVNRSEWGAPTFIIPKKDGTVWFISDFRELNKRIVRRPYPIPHIQDMLLNLEGFQYATSLALNMGYYHIELNPDSKKYCTIVMPFGKYEYQCIPMGLGNSPNIFQEKMSELMEGLDFVQTYIDDLLVIAKESFEDHLEKLDLVLQRLEDAGLKVNGNKSFFAQTDLEYLGYWITRKGIKPLPDKVKAIMKIAEPKN
jgi:Reverse transcriptase (RNA-dependent DNA polymerase)